MSEIDQLKNELRQIQLAYALQRQISHFKGGFLARISHELRSPLSQLTSLHQLILNDLCEDPQEERFRGSRQYRPPSSRPKLPFIDSSKV